VNRKALQLALREMQAVGSSRYTRIGLMLAIVLLAVSGPFGTYEGSSVGQRFAYWAIMVIASFVAGQIGASFFIELLREHISQRWPRVLAGGLLASLPVTIVVLLVNGLAHPQVPVAESLTIWFYTAIVTLVVVVALVTLRDFMAAAPVAPGAATADEAATLRPAPPAILERVPLPQRGKLLALIVEDHYVDIVTDKGKTLVLMRLADAIREAAPIPGLQIHRSHWVALAAVAKATRSEGRVSLELSNGLRLPVSRGYMQAVKDAGLV
jgi:hypothetical protein